MSTLKQFISEIETTFQNFTETGDIDRVSIKGWVISCLREFGKNICDKREAIIEIKNSQGKLPETFKSLILALDLSPQGYKIHGDKEKAKDSFIYRQRIEQSGFYDFSSNTFVNDSSAKLITESIISNNEKIDLYHKPSYLSVIKGFRKESFDVECLNLHPSIRNSYPHEININKTTLQTNFKNGSVYIQYNSLPTSDEDGEIEIPILTTGDIEKYIENFVKLKIGENLILNNKNPTAISSLMSLWQQQVIPLRNAAKSEANWSGLPKGWEKEYNKKLNMQMSQYNLPSF